MPEPRKNSQTESLVINVLWNWFAVAINIFAGVALTPYIVHKLGDSRYGVWALAFAFMEYALMFDLGFRSAVVNFVARFRAREDYQAINELMNTAVAYLAVAASVIVTLALFGAGLAVRLFQITPDNRSAFVYLVKVIGFTWGFAMVASVFDAGLQAFAQFKTVNRLLAASMAVRSLGCVGLLYLGYGLRAMALVVVFSQVSTYTLMFLAFRRIVPAFHFSLNFVSRARLRELFGYGIHSVVASSASMLLNQGPPLVIGRYLPEAYVGYYAVPWRLLQYMVDLINRIGLVTSPKTAELFAVGRLDQITRLGILVNRYSFALFMPISIFVSVYAYNLLTRWIGPSYAAHSAPLIPVFAFSVTFVFAGQFNTTQLLYGIAQHGPYSRLILAEAIAGIVITVLVLPRYGMFGAAVVVCGLAVLSRGLITPYILCRHLGCSYARYMLSIYTRPVLTGVFILLLAFAMHTYWLPGYTWPQLILAAAIIGSVSVGVSYFTCVEKTHQDVFVDNLRRRIFGPVRRRFVKVSGRRSDG